jgi:LmbE family N-acetylglucosaminyl deacetylase
MFELTLGRNGQAPREILFIGAHCDDIEIGCGGGVLRLAREYPDARVHWLVLTSDRTRAAEAARSAELFLADVKHKTVTIKDFRDGYVPHLGTEVKDFFEQVKDTVKPDVIFTHHGGDRHQDHRALSEHTWNTFRNHLILEYEIPKYDGGLESPNVFFPLEERDYARKLDILLECFETQRGKQWFSREMFLGLMRLRGVECNAASGYAEGFHCRKAVL